MILWTALRGVAQYALEGKLGWQYILYGTVIGLVRGQSGQQLKVAALKGSGRPSMVVFLLGGIVPNVAVLAGVTAEPFGIDGGMTIVPFFITLDMQPKV